MFHLMGPVFLYFFQTFGLGVSVNIRLVSRLELWLELRLGFRLTFYVYYVSTKPNAFSLCVTVMLQEIIE